MRADLVDVLSPTLEESSAFCAAWSAIVPELEFVPSLDAQWLLRALEARRPTAIVVRVLDEQTRSFVSELARRYPALPLLVIGEVHRDASSRRFAPVLVLGALDQIAVERFFRDDVLGAARGTLHGVALASVVQVLSIERRTCVLRVRSGRRSGVLVIRTGAVVHAEYEPFEGRKRSVIRAPFSTFASPRFAELRRVVRRHSQFFSAGPSSARESPCVLRPAETTLPAAAIPL